MMDDISSKISNLLNNPDGIEKIKQMAKSILGDEKENEPEENASFDLGNISLPDGLFENMGNMQGLMRIASLLGKKEEDSRVNLLLALKPHLSVERASRVDKAISMLKIASLLPVLKEEGLLDSLGGIL